MNTRKAACLCKSEGEGVTGLKPGKLMPYDENLEICVKTTIDHEEYTCI